MCHSFSQVYLAFEFWGMENLHQRLLDQPGYRLDVKDAVDCTMQIAGALAHCHSRDVVHRQVSLKHIVMEDQSEMPFCRLVDFFQAALCPESTPLATPCGDLPRIAPEVVVDESYVAKPVDCWSLGVVLLEAAGGLGSMRQVVGWPEEAELEPTARRIKNIFSGEGSHARALDGHGRRSQRAGAGQSIRTARADSHGSGGHVCVAPLKAPGSGSLRPAPWRLGRPRGLERGRTPL
ncbi:unnamed protein product [Prorocentrum cordatum]|uniref:Protein kinase domain-containing protein n=1 Tax=Prorocentrum cordatum TaxID=2364126 RepID=A0ABN9W9H6_9DINO|nr:unnamed protein product [Polarella glacialis]